MPAAPCCSAARGCRRGSAAEAPCAPGTYNDQPQQEACVKCAAGKFQELEGQTACDDCTPGYYCKLGAAEPALVAAAAALDSINKKDLGELKNLGKPPAGIDDAEAECQRVSLGVLLQHSESGGAELADKCAEAVAAAEDAHARRAVLHARAEQSGICTIV